MSNINPNNVDGTYPIAGQDNDSQGFRDNFTNLKSNLTFAKSELEDLASKVVLKSALTGTSLNNDFGDALMTAAKIKDFSETRFDQGTISGTVTLNHVEGHYQTVTTAGNITIAFSNLPAAAALGRIRLEVEVASTSHTMTLPAEVTIGVDGLLGTVANVMSFAETGKFIFEFTTEDAGATIAINDLTRSRMLPVASAPVAVLTGNATTGSAALGNVGLAFTAKANARYKFEAFIPFTHSASSTNTHTFSVNFSAGTCYALIEQQASPTGVFALDTISTSDATGGVVTTTSTSAKLCKITGTFTHTAATTVSMRFATNGGTLTALAGANLMWTQVG
tara:strand:- start:12801 stop:13808 length:1008 start_codon:yes stop_codon:yes gene_type:complete